MHAAIHLKEIPEESIRHDDYATNHNYAGSSPTPSHQTTGTGNGSGQSSAHGDFDFAGYK